MASYIHAGEDLKLSQVGTQDAGGLGQEESVQGPKKQVRWCWECLGAETH